MDKLLDILSTMLPEDKMKEISEAVANMLEETKAGLEAEADKNLEEAYAELAEQVRKAEQVAEEGYQEAWDVITELRNRIVTLRAEYDSALEEGYEEAYQVVLAERGKNETLEMELHNEYEKRFSESEEFVVDKLDMFLKAKGKEIYEMARRDVMNDPSMVEHKVVLDKIVESVSNYITDEDRVLATSSRLSALQEALEKSDARIRMLESKNIRLDLDNKKLNEQVKEAAELLTESQDTVVAENKKARVEKAKNATGRGTVTNDTKVIAEFADDKKGDQEDTTLVESLGEEFMKNLQSMQILAGTKASN